MKMMKTGLFEVAQLGVLDFAIHLRHRLFAAHRQHGVTEPDQNADESDGVGQRRVLQPPERVVAKTSDSRDAARAEGARLASRACRRTSRSTGPP